MEAQLDDEQGMLEQEAAQLAGVAHSFPHADEKGFEICITCYSYDGWQCEAMHYLLQIWSSDGVRFRYMHYLLQIWSQVSDRFRQMNYLHPSIERLKHAYAEPATTAVEVAEGLFAI